MNEIWKDIVGYEGLYQVSNLGRVKSLDRKRWNGRVLCPVKGRVLVGKSTKQGYLQVSLGRRNYVYIHRLVAQMFISNPKNKSEVNHINGIKTDNRVENLSWVSRSENMKHASDNNFMRCGEQHYHHKLTRESVLFIRTNYKRYDRDFGCVAFAKRFGVTPEIISRVIRGVAWK